MATSIGPKRYSYQELAEATDKFSGINFIGRGGYGEVYKGLLDQELRAIKKLRITSNEKRKREMEHEIKVINSVSHRNLVKLVGYCIEGQDVLLVLEYFPNKCLRHNLHESRKTLDWDKRMQIAKGVANGLKYLHEDCDPKIIHQDIKPGNILVDDNFQPKIADFGLALTLQINTTHVSYSTEGTEIYREKSKRTSDKSDVYSFGVVLLELITGKQPTWGNNDIINWAKNLIKPAMEGQYMNFVDPNLQSYNKEEIKRLIYCAANCVYKSSTDRPKIKEIVQVLEGLVSLKEKDADDNNFLYSDPSVDLLRPTVQKLSIIPETDDDNDTAGSEVYNPRIFTHRQLVNATQGFSQLLCEGVLGPVFMGSIDGKEVVVWKLNNLPHEIRKEELEQDIKNICNVNHPNLDKMIGYCIEELERCLVLEFFPSNTLESHLNGNKMLDWSKRVKIAIDCAKALKYLHENGKTIYGKNMTYHIFIDNKFQAKVEYFGINFGLIHYRHERSKDYADPKDRKEIFEKSDIYAFGVVLLKLITGKTTNNIVNEENIHMQQALNGEYRAILDSKLQRDYNKEELERMIYCAAACLHNSSKSRLKIEKIVEVLEGIIPPRDLLDANDNQFSQSTMLKGPFLAYENQRSTIARHADGLPLPVLNPQTINMTMPGALPVSQMFLNQAMPTYNGTIPIHIPGTSIDPSQLQMPTTFTYGTTPYNYAPFY